MNSNIYYWRFYHSGNLGGKTLNESKGRYNAKVYYRISIAVPEERKDKDKGDS